MIRHLKPTSLSLAVMLASGAPAAISQVMLEEVVVTAQKREQSLQDTPISISAFGAEALESQGISDIGDVSQYTPNVQIAESPGGSTGATIAMRGSVTVNPVVTIDTNVGVYIDGVFIAKNVGGLFDVAELERIEVLRGPQGTLYGKNTVAGAINLISRKPSGEFSGKVKVGGGNYGSQEIFATVDSNRIADKLSLNVAVSQKERDGFYNNISTVAKVDEFKKLDSFSARLAANYDATDDLNLYYTYDMSEKENTPTFAQLGGGPDERKSKGKSDGVDVDNSESEGHALHITYQLNDSMTFKSITAYREMTFDDVNDYDGGDSTFFLLHAERHVDQEQLSQEFQLIGNVGDVNYVAGFFYFNEEVKVLNPLIQQFGGPLMVRNNAYGSDSESYAVYGQADWAINDQWTLTAGARWTTEEKDGFIDHPDDFLVGQVPFSEKTNDKWDNFSPMAVLTYNITDDTSTYFKVSQGWKSGGFNAEAPSAAIAQISYDEETVTSLELGLKSRLMDDRLQVNLAVFQNEIEDLQLSEVDPATFYSTISNAGESTVKGAEVELLFAVSPNLTASFNYGYLDAEYNEFMIGGVDIKNQAEFPYTPENTWSLGLDYVKEVNYGEWSVRLDWSYVDEHVVFHDAGQAALTAVDDYSLVNARVALSNIPVGNNFMAVSAWGKNLADTEYRNNGIPNGPTSAINYYGDPLTWGIDIAYEF